MLHTDFLEALVELSDSQRARVAGEATTPHSQQHVIVAAESRWCIQLLFREAVI